MSSVDAPVVHADKAATAKFDHDLQTPTEEFAAPMEQHYDQKQAAELIQRNYRGYRSRRQLRGMGLDSSTRWAEVWVSYLELSFLYVSTDYGALRRPSKKVSHLPTST